MKKISYLLAIVVFFCCTFTVNATEIAPEKKEGPFYFDWENEKIKDGYEILPLLKDNIAYKSGSIVVQTTPDKEDNPITTIKMYDIKGKELKSKELKDTLFFSIITDNTNIYLVVTTGVEDSVQKLIKLDENLKVVKELPFADDYTPGVDGMVNARIFGHDILAIKNDYLYVFCGEEYMLKTKLDLSKWENMKYSKTAFAKYFPDLSAEYDLMFTWMEKMYNENYMGAYLDMEVTTHVYEEKTISSGMRIYRLNKEITPFTGFIRIKDSSGKVIFEETTEDYVKIIEARIIGDYVVAIALTEAGMGINQTGFTNTKELGNDIIIFDMDGNLVQTIETEGSYLFLNEISSGFIVTHVESCTMNDSGLENSSLNLTGNATYDSFKNQTSNIIEQYNDIQMMLYNSNVCTYNTEAYYLPLEVETKVSGKGKVESIHDTRRGEVITFKVSPEDGYELSEVKVTDKNGNTVIFTDYTFTMPNADVTIEAIFIPKENPETADIAIIAIIITALFGLIAFFQTKKKLNWLK